MFSQGVGAAAQVSVQLLGGFQDNMKGCKDVCTERECGITGNVSTSLNYRAEGNTWEGDGLE